MSRVATCAADAHGEQYLRGWRNGTDTWQTCGSFGVVSCFSFYANKIISTGEGGMVLTDDPALARRLRSLRNLYFEPERRFHHAELGCNFRLTNLQAAVGLAQLETIEARLEHKRWMGEAYRERLAGIPGLSLQTIKPWARPVYWMLGIVVDERIGKTAAKVSDRLAATGVMTRPFFRGMHEQPALHRKGLFQDERVSRRGSPRAPGAVSAVRTNAHTRATRAGVRRCRVRPQIGSGQD